MTHMAFETDGISALDTQLFQKKNQIDHASRECKCKCLITKIT